MRGDCSISIRTGLIAAALLLCATALSAQSLAAVAERAGQQRSAGAPSRRFSDADLKPVRGSAPDPDVTSGSSSPVPQLSPDAPREEIVRAVMPAVVTIEAGGATGTAFFVTSSLLATNRHVVNGQQSVRVTFADGTGSAGSVSAEASDADLVLVRVDQPPPGHPVLRLAPAREVSVGEEVLAVGSALGLFQGTVTRGIVSAFRRASGITMIQTDAAINPGNSGGPLVNRTGAVVGITTAKMNGAESIGFAIATDHVSALLRGNSAVAREDGPGPGGSTPSIEAALGDSGRSDTERLRRQGEEQFERTVTTLSHAADGLDAEWLRFKRNCGQPSAGSRSAGREWFGIWNAARDDAAISASCRSLRDYVAGQGASISSAMTEAAEAARRSGVFPGTVRTVQQRYGMDWDGWER
ncbi:MAG: trypsin-like peptidase domain-containing protein [Acidobacteria bacterium]|nr:trypsin-like peptidase domain-containing protein [Acidobacteriota bacterium]